HFIKDDPGDDGRRYRLEPKNDGSTHRIGTFLESGLDPCCQKRTAQDSIGYSGYKVSGDMKTGYRYFRNQEPCSCEYGSRDELQQDQGILSRYINRTVLCPSVDVHA